MTLSVKKIRKEESVQNGKTSINHTYYLEGALPTWDGDHEDIKIQIHSKSKLEIEENSLLKLKVTGKQSKLLTAEGNSKKDVKEVKPIKKSKK